MKKIGDDRIKFLLSGQFNLNKNKRKVAVTFNLANVQTYASQTPCPVAKKKTKQTTTTTTTTNVKDLSVQQLFYDAEHDLNNYADRGGCFPARPKSLQNNTHFKTCFKLSSRLYLSFLTIFRLQRDVRNPFFK